MKKLGSYRSRSERSPEYDLMRLKFIKRIQRLGFSLNEIQAVMAMLNRNNSVNSEILKKQITLKLDEIDQRIGALTELKEVLELSRNNLNLEDCGLLKFVTDTEKNQ